MAEAAKNEEKKVIDEGLERGAAKLSEDRIATVINRVIKGETGARLKAYVRPAFTAVCARRRATTIFPTTMIRAIHRWEK